MHERMRHRDGCEPSSVGWQGLSKGKHNTNPEVHWTYVTSIRLRKGAGDIPHANMGQVRPGTQFSYGRSEPDEESSAPPRTLV